MPAIVVIGPAEALATLRAQLPSDSTFHSFTDHQVRDAVEHIAIHRPAVVAIEEAFAVSPRGEALVARIMEDPSLSACEIRILAHAHKPERERTSRKSGSAIPVATVPVPPPAAAGLPVVLDRRGTRRAERVRLAQGVVIIVDGNPAELVDLSAVGAQVISRVVLRPNQRVRLQLPDQKVEGARPLRCSASVVWASFEMPSGQPPRYRAGLKLSPAESDALQSFAALHRAPQESEK